jgi:hypothetical protein
MITYTRPRTTASAKPRLRRAYVTGGEISYRLWLEMSDLDRALYRREQTALTDREVDSCTFCGAALDPTRKATPTGSEVCSGTTRLHRSAIWSGLR